MISFTDQDYRDLCRAGAVQAEMGGLDEKRHAAILRFWLFLLGSVLAAAAIAWLFVATGAINLAIWLGLLALFAGVGFAMKPLASLGREIKAPVLGALAQKGGLAYLADGFAPPVYPDARQALFGKWLSSEKFSDLFHGNDQDGLRIAFYEATLRKRSGKSTYVVFSGQAYAFQRRARASAEIVIVPDRGLFNFFKPAPGAERVKFDSDPEFEGKFEVYATEPSAAQLLIGSDVRRTLLELRQAGKVFAYVGGDDAFVAVTGKNRFEPGGLFRSTPSDQRIKAMFDDVCASATLLERLKAVLG